MKKIILIAVVVLIASCAITSEVLESPNPIIVDVQTPHNRENSYIKANEWMISQFNNAESVIQFSDKENGIVKGKYTNVTASGPISYGYGVTSPAVAAQTAIITVRVKDKAARIEIEPLGTFSSTVWNNIEYGYLPEHFTILADILADSFKANMQEEDKNKSW